MYQDVNVAVNGCLGVCVGSVLDWQPAFCLSLTIYALGQAPAWRLGMLPDVAAT